MFNLAGKRARAFTLIELLVVMAIIMMLAAISVPVYNRIRGVGYLRSCQGNLSGIGKAFHLYRTDNDGWMPYALHDGVLQTEKGGKAIGWKYELSFYMGNHTNQEKRARSYPLNEAFIDPVKGRGQGNYMLSKKHFGSKTEVDVRTPSGGRAWTGFEVTEATEFTSGRTSIPDGFMKYEHWNEPSRAAIIGPSVDPKMHRGYGRQGNSIYIDYRHGGKANILFLDGHVQVFQSGDEKLFEFFDKKELSNDRIKQID